MSIRLIRLIKLITVTASVLFTAGCNREEANPEHRDPIYQDLRIQYNKYAKMLEDAEKKLLVIETELAAVEPRSFDSNIKNREYQRALKGTLKIKEMTQYYKIKSDLRRVYGRKEYRIAFKNGEKWPNPKDFEDYKTNKRLRAASRNWNDRVPKSKHQEISEQLSEESPTQTE